MASEGFKFLNLVTWILEAVFVRSETFSGFQGWLLIYLFKIHVVKVTYFWGISAGAVFELPLMGFAVLPWEGDPPKPLNPKSWSSGWSAGLTVMVPQRKEGGEEMRWATVSGCILHNSNTACTPSTCTWPPCRQLEEGVSVNCCLRRLSEEDLW